MLTKEEILKSLRALGAPSDKPVIVHTSLKQIGAIEGGAETLLDALIDHFTSQGGLLCIPTHTWGFMYDKTVPTLDLLVPRSNLGVLPTIAAKDNRGIRSLHPTHSVTVFGDRDKANTFIADDEIATTMAPVNGCLGKIIDYNGYVLLLGVGHDKNTLLHIIEERMGVKNRIAETTDTVTIRYLDGHIESRQIYSFYSEGIYDVSKQFPNYEPAFRYHECITDGLLGSAKAQLCNASKMAETMNLIHRRSGGKELLNDRTPIPEEFYK